MPRPLHERTVGPSLPQGVVVAPCGPGRARRAPSVEELTLDGLEALRLVDVEGLYQEAAAERMGVSRATFARVLAKARRAVAEALLHQRPLVIGGGAVRTGPPSAWPCPVHGGRRRRGRGCRCRGEGRGRAWGSGAGRTDSTEAPSGAEEE